MAVFVRRLIGATMLDAATYEEIEGDRHATLQALAVVMLASLAAGVGARGASGARPALEFFLVGTVLSLATWAAFAALTLVIGVSWLASAQAPSLYPSQRCSCTPTAAMLAAISRRRSRASRTGGHETGSSVPRSPAVAVTTTTRRPWRRASAMRPEVR